MFNKTLFYCVWLGLIFFQLTGVVSRACAQSQNGQWVQSAEAACAQNVDVNNCIKSWGVYDVNFSPTYDIGYCLQYYKGPQLAALHCQGKIQCTAIDRGPDGTGCNVSYRPEFFEKNAELKQCIITCKQPFLDQTDYCNSLSYNVTRPPSCFDNVLKQSSCECIYGCLEAFSKACSQAPAKCACEDVSSPAGNVPTRNQHDGTGEAGKYACGATCAAMALAYFGQDVSTQQLMQEVRQQRGGATWGNLISTVRRHLPHSASNVIGAPFWEPASTTEWIKKETKKGALAVVSIKGDYCDRTTGDGSHYILVTSVDDGGVYFNDPGDGSQRKMSLECLSSIVQGSEQTNEDVRFPVLIIRPASKWKYAASVRP